MNRLFEDFFRGPGLWGGFADMSRAGFEPAVDVRETADEVIVEAELPGIEPEDVDVSLEGRTLRLTGERRHEHEERTKSVHRVERFYGSFERHIPLPEGIDPEKVEASYKNGVLSVHVGKREDVRPRSIPVKAGK